MSGTVRPPSASRPLADGVFAVAVDEDIVILDCRTDAYACLPDAASELTVSDRTVRGSTEALAELTEAGLFTDGAALRRALLPSHAVVVLDSRSAGFNVRDIVNLAGAVGRAHRIGPAPVAALVAALPRAGARAPEARRVAAVTRTFQTALPWIPGQGACLYRAFVLLTMLRLAGQDATWVFGVRTWPFGAHCWLQFGGAVLDDDPERIALYTPIMAV